MKKCSLKIFLVFVVILATALSSFATNYDEKLKGVKQNLKDVKEQKSDRQQKLKELNQMTIVLDARIDDSEKKIGKIAENMKTKHAEIEKTQAKITEYQKSIEKNNDLLAKRLKVIYRTSEIDYLRVILNSETMEDALSNVTMIKKIIKRDREILEQLRISKEAVETEKAALEKQERKMKSLKEGLEAEQALLERTKKEQEESKEQIKQDLVKLELIEEQMLKEANALESKIRELQQINGLGGPYKGGTMGWPLASAGRFTSGYGGRVNPITHRQEFHSGVDLAAPMGTGILAANDGKVIFAGNRGTYGKAILVDHGGGVVTLYGHCSSFVASEGQMVNKGQIIARVGSTGYSTGPHLHFEVRINGKHVNPSGYIGLN